MRTLILVAEALSILLNNLDFRRQRMFIIYHQRLMGNNICCEGASPPSLPESEFQALAFPALSPEIQRVLDQKKPFESKLSKKWKTQVIDGDIYQTDQNGSRQPHGYGRVFKKDGSYYVGEFNKGKAHGMDSLSRNLFERNVANDKNGKYTSKRGVYQGQFKNSKFDGSGVEKGADYQFKGIYEDGRRKRGVLTWTEDEKKYKYEGQFDHNQLFTGEAVLNQPQGTYTGSFKAGLKEGKGKYVAVSGITYEGGYHNNQKSGKGKISNSNGTPSYEGQMKNGLPNGKGYFYSHKKPAVQTNFIEGVDTRFVSQQDYHRLLEKVQANN